MSNPYSLTDDQRADAIASAGNLREHLEARHEKANERLLQLLIDDFRALVRELMADGKGWKEIANIAGLPEYVVRVLCGETAGRRMTPDKQSGR